MVTKMPKKARWMAMVVCAALLPAKAGAQYTIRLFAGGGPPEGSLATSAGVHCGSIAVDAVGNVFVAGGASDRIYKVSSSGLLTTIAGTGVAGFSGDGGPATSAQVTEPEGVFLDAFGNLFIIDATRIRKILPSGIIVTVAGNGIDGFSGDGELAVNAMLFRPQGITADRDGNLFIADTINSRIRKVNASGIITTVAGNGSLGFSGDGGPAVAAALRNPRGVAVDGAGNLYISDTGNNRIRKVSAAGVITTIAGRADFNGFSGDGGPAVNALLTFPAAILVDGAGNLIFADYLNYRIRKISESGVITTIAGNGIEGWSGDTGPALNAQLNRPFGVTMDSAGNLYIGEFSRIRKVMPNGVISTIAGNGTEGFSGDGGPAIRASLASPNGVAVGNDESVYIADVFSTRIRAVAAGGVMTTIAGTGSAQFSGDGGPATAAGLGVPIGVAADSAGNAYIFEALGRVRKVTANGVISTIAGTDTQGFSGDGGPATSAQLAGPCSGAVDANGNLFIGDRYNHRIRKVSANAIITTVAGNGVAGFSGNGGLATNAALFEPCGVAVDSAGNLFIADSRNAQVRRVGTNGVITTVAGSYWGFGGDGGPATSAQLSYVSSIALDSAGNLFIADLYNRRIRRVSADGVITTIAGNGNSGASGDGGPAANAELSSPTGVAVDNRGNIYVADQGSNSVRVLTRGVFVQPPALVFSYQIGADGPIPQVLSIANPAAVVVTASVSTVAEWLSVTPASGPTPTNFTVAVNPTGLAGGVYYSSIRLTTPTGAVEAPVTLSVTTACTIGLTSNSFAAAASGATAGFTVNASAGCQWTASSDVPWITILSGGGGLGPGAVMYRVDSNSGWARSGTISVTGNRILTVNQSAPVDYSAGLRFVPVAPCRVVDTRPAYAGFRSGAFGPPLLPGGTTRTVPIPVSTTCSIPSSAKGYVLNVTLDTTENQTGPVDFITLWPTGEARPDFYTVRTTTGGYIANAAIVKAGTNGAINVYSTNNVHLILDISGYFTDSLPGLLYYPISPCRAVDTRGPVYSSLPPPYGNRRMQARETRTFRLPGSPGCQIPVASAYSMQLTLVPGELTDGNPVAFITAYPTGGGQPNISNMNSFSGYVVANSAIAPASGNGSIDVYAYDATNLIIDVNGYFAPDDGTGRGLSYYPVTQCRVMNTQDTSLTGPFGAPALSPGTDRAVPIPAGRCGGLSSTARAWAANVSVVPNGGSMPYLSLWPSGTEWPNISQLNAFQGQTLSNSSIVPAPATGSINVRVAGATHVVVEINGYFGR